LDQVNEEWLLATVEKQVGIIEKLEARLAKVEGELENQVRRRDSVALAEGTKSVGFKVYHDATDEAEAIKIIETEIRLRKHAQEVWDGTKQPITQAPAGMYEPEKKEGGQ